MLPGREAEVGSKVPTGSEAADIAHVGDERRGGEHADPGYAHQGLGLGHVPDEALETSLDVACLGPEFVDLAERILEDGLDFAFRAGGGVDIYLTEHFLLNWEAGAMLPIGSLQNLNYYFFNWGLQYRF